MPSTNSHEFHGVLAKDAAGLVLTNADGPDLRVRSPDGLERLVGSRVCVLGTIDESEKINVYRAQPDWTSEIPN